MHCIILMYLLYVVVLKGLPNSLMFILIYYNFRVVVISLIISLVNLEVLFKILFCPISFLVQFQSWYNNPIL
jgi:ABC-type arginine transport system permease subunit